MEAYKKILLSSKRYIVNLEASKTYEQAISVIGLSAYDVIFINMQLVAAEKDDTISGEKLAILIRNKQLHAKIVLIMSDNNPRAYSILKTIPHDGLLIQKDITSEIILQALDTTLNNAPFYTETIRNLSPPMLLKDIFLDEFNKKILYHISLGVRTKKLVNYIPLSLSAIEKRKSNIKTLFNVESDEQLIKKAREGGFV